MSLVRPSTFHRIMVTQAHIDRGNRMNGQTCPVALALKEATGTAWMVRTRTVSLDASPGCVDRWPLPLTIQRWIQRFDAHENVEPFVWHLPRRLLVRKVTSRC